MKIVFTVCSNNYLAKAKVLADSVMRHSPDYRFIFGLCDKKSEQIDYASFAPHEFVEVDELGIKNLEWMILNYNIIELNTSVKPFYFQYFLEKYKDLEMLVYLDPDTKVYYCLDALEQEMGDKAMMLTPHILSPIPPDKQTPTEETFQLHGLYNLGFLAVKPSSETDRMIAWWADRLSKQCFDLPSEGLFVDQLPMNYIPLFSDSVHVSKHRGMNFAYWNIHERRLSLQGDTYYVNEDYPLLFFHFSNFSPAEPLRLTMTSQRFTDEFQSETMRDFCKVYANELLSNNFWEQKTIPCHYIALRQKMLLERKPKVNKVKRELMRVVDQITGKSKKKKKIAKK